MMALSIRQPWAWLIINAGKDIENRTWYTGQRGRFLVHASQGMTRREYSNAIHFMVDQGLDQLPCDLPAFEQFERGGIVGSVDLVDVCWESRSGWFVGPHGFVLRDPTPLPFTPFKGRLGFFDIPGTWA